MDEEELDAEISQEEAEIAQMEEDMAVDDAREKAAAAAKLKAAALAKQKKKQADVTERPPPNPDWVRPDGSPSDGPYRAVRSHAISSLTDFLERYQIDIHASD